jgi:hypothetical protein
MKTNQKTLGALFVVVVGGCAGTKSTAIPLTPVAQGIPVDVTSYDLNVDGAPGGQVLMREGRAIRDSHGNERIQVQLEIDNRTGDRTFRMPTDQIWIANFGNQTAKLIQVDEAAAPSSIEVAAGGTELHTLTFTPTRAIALRTLRTADVHWTLLIDGATEPVARTTSFMAVRQIDENRQMADTRNWDPPATADDGTWNTGNRNQIGSTRAAASTHVYGAQRRPQQLPSGQP